MENMGGEESLSGGSSHITSTTVERQCIPLNMAAQQVHSKGSQLDRITFHEERLVQVIYYITNASFVSVLIFIL